MRSWRTIIGKAVQEAAALQPGPYVLFEPGIQDMMEDYSGQHR
jgi:hypothetical protein